MTNLLERFAVLCEQLRSVTDVAKREHLVSVFVTNSYWARISQAPDGPLPEVPAPSPSIADVIDALTNEQLDQMKRDGEESGLADTFRKGFNDEIAEQLHSRAGFERLANINPPWEMP